MSIGGTGKRKQMTRTRYSPSRWYELTELFLASIGLGCRHPEKTWPLSSWHGPVWARKRITTQTCLTCGKHIEYSGPLTD